MYTHTYLVHSFSILLDQLCLQGVSCRSHPEDPGSSEHKAANFSILRIPGRVPSRPGIAQIAGKWEPHSCSLTLVHLLNPFKRKGFMDAEQEMNTCTLLSVKVSENPLLFDSFSFPNELLHHWKLTSNQEPTATQCPRAIPGCSSISIWWHHQEILKFYLVRLPKLRTLGTC